MEPIEMLRGMIGERVPPGGTEVDTNFIDAELEAILSHSQNRLYLAAALCWAMKAAFYADLVDISESGSERKLSQLTRQAREMEALYRKQASIEEEAFLGALRAAPRSARWAVPADERVPYPTEIASGGQTTIRNFPLMRSFFNIKR